MRLFLVTIDEFLPLGLPASPLLANLICRALDDNLKTLADRKGAVYTRYADDITFSGSGDLPEKIEVQEILANEGFALSERKFHRSVRGQSHFVTGLSVSESKPYIPRLLKQKIRQELYFAEKFGLVGHLSKIKSKTIQSGINRIAGTIRYFNAVEPELAAKLEARWKNILKQGDFEVRYLSDLNAKSGSFSIIIDESVLDTPDGKLLIIGCVVTHDIEKINERTQEIYQERLDDPYGSDDKKALAKKGLHFVDLSEDGRTRYIESLQMLPFKAFLIYDLLPDANPSKYKEKYFDLLNQLIVPRLKKLDRAEVEIIVEQNPQVPFKELERYFSGIYDEMAAKYQKRPRKPPTIVDGVKIEHHSISVIDFVLAVFGQYSALNYIPKVEDKTLELGAMEPKSKKREAGSLKSTRFERLREKYRLIIARPTNEFYSQKNPFVAWNEGKPTEPKTKPTPCAT